MRWPFRRHSDPPRLTAPAPESEARASSSGAVSGAAPGAVAGSITDAAPRSTPRSTPRSDWARLAPIGATLHTSAPLTFHGDRFGRSVAGARTMAASQRHRPAHSGRAPSGLLLDVARIESVEPVERRAEPEIPPVGSHGPSTAPVHRKVVEHAPRTGLMTSDMEVAFPDTPPIREPEPELGSLAVPAGTRTATRTGTTGPGRHRRGGDRCARQRRARRPLAGDH
jgi:hypothetical protein